MTPKSALFVMRARLARRLGRRVRLWLVLYLALVLALFGMALCALSLLWRGFNEAAPARMLAWAVWAGLSGGGGLCLAALLVRPLPGPQGIRVQPRCAPELHALVRRMGDRLGAGAVAQIWISPEMNAALVQRPAWGCLGPVRSHLMLGFPLLHSVSAEQLEAILAHELAHLARQRSGREAVDAHLRALWIRLMDRACGCLPDALASVCERYCRDMLRLSRLEEYEADAVAATLVGPARMASALVEVELKARFLDSEYWPAVMAHSRRHPQRPLHPYREMGRRVERVFLRDACGSVRAGAEDREPGQGPHPVLRQRLHLLHASSAATPVGGPSAARHYFAAMLPDVAWAFDLIWRAAARQDSARRRAAAIFMRRVETVTGPRGYRR